MADDKPDLPAGFARVGDAAIKHGLGGWWDRLDSDQKGAVGVLGACVAIGPLGQGILGGVQKLYSPALPSSKQVAAVFLLALMTAPVFLAAGVGAYLVNRVGGYGLLLACALAAYFGGAGVASVAVPELAGVYCYADVSSSGVVYEDECRRFDSLGFASRAQPGSPNQNAQVLAWAFIYTVDARGFVMALAGLGAGSSIGYLVRRQSEANA